MTPQHDDHDLGISPEPERPGPSEPYVPDDVDDRPTAKQLTYLRALANRTGQTFAYPRTVNQASREIRRLKAVKPSTRLERAIERSDHASEHSAREANCDVPVDIDREVTGYGSTATWSGQS